MIFVVVWCIVPYTIQYQGLHRCKIGAPCYNFGLCCKQDTESTYNTLDAAVENNLFVNCTTVRSAQSPSCDCGTCFPAWTVLLFIDKPILHCYCSRILILIRTMAPTTDVNVVYTETTAVSSSSISNSKDDCLADLILNNLTECEKEQAARASSYQYLVASADPAQAPSSDVRDRHAKATIERYLAVERKLNKNSTVEEWTTNAENRLKKTLEYRLTNNVDDIRLCFETHTAESSVHAYLREGLVKRFANKASLIRGFSKEGHALFQNFPRADTSWEEEFYIKGNIYMLEKALACTETRTGGKKDKVIVLYDYNSYAMKNTPPTMLVKRLLYNLRDHYPERLEQVFVVDAPFIFRAFWAVVKHFIDPITKGLVQFVSGEEEKKLVLGSIISEDEASPWMLQGGKVVDEVDVNKFFYDTPFDHMYEDKGNGAA